MEKAENCQSESDSDTEFFDAAEESPCMPPCQDKNKSGIIPDEESALQVSKNEHQGLQLNLVHHFNDTVAQQDSEQKSLEREHLEKVKNSNCGFLSATGTLSPITECDPVEQFARENEAIELSVRSHSSEDVENELSPSTTGAEQMKSKECKTIDNEDVLQGELGTKCDLGAECIDVGVISLDKPVNNKLSLEEDTPPPVAPPRRKRKKKRNTSNSGEEVSPLSRNAPSSVEDNHSSQPVQEQSKAEQVKVIGQEKRVITDSFDSIDGRPKLQSDPSIELDGDTQEMNRVLVKTNSTEVVSSLILDSRLKSPSVSSLCSRSDLSDSYASVASNLSNGHIRRSGSLTSVGSTHSHAGHVSNLVRVRSASGRPLSDTEILEQVMVRNLDTGELVPLSVAEEKLPECTNPLALHIMKVTSEYSSNPDLAGQDQEDGAEVNKKISKKTKKLKKFFGKRVHKIKSEPRVNSKQRGDDGSSSSEEEGPQQPNTPYIKIKSAHGKGPVEFEKLKLLQDLSGVHVGAVWTIKFSVCGRIMATAGQDNIVRVWILKEFQEYFEEMRRKYSRDGEIAASPASEEEVNNTEDDPLQDTNTDNQEDDPGPFKKTPFCTYQGHTGDVLDLTWSKNYFLLSSSMDKTVRLWHISRNECLCCFQHIDFVTAIIFHPRDDRYFLSGSLDGKIRLWNIPDKKVALWNEIEGTGSSLITAANFVMNGKFAVVGTYDGRCIFYETERLKYHTQWQVRPSRNKKARGRKISGIEPMPGEEKVLITSNDSRIRLYDLKDNSLYCKYKGCANTSSQIKAGFSHDGQYIVCGSEDHFVYIWRTQHGIASSRRDKNDYFESFSAHEAVVTAAMFAPVPWLVVAPDAISDQVTSEVLVTADWTGAIKLFVNR